MLKAFSPFAIALSVFLILEGVINFSPVGTCLEQKISMSLSKKMEQLEQDNPNHMDLLFLGTSRTGAGFHTSYFEKNFPGKTNAFNLGFQDSDYYFFKLVLDQYIHKHGKPKVVLIEAADFLLNSKRFSNQEAVYFYKMILNRPETLMDIMLTPALSVSDKKETVFSLLSGTYRYRSLLALNGQFSDTILNLHHNLEQKMFQGWDLTPVKPDMEQSKSRSAMALYRVRNLFRDFEQVNTFKLRLFLDFCRAKGVTVVLVKWPVTDEYQAALRKLPLHLDTEQEFSNIAKRSNASFIDLSAVSVDNISRYFADSDHLNPKGADFYTQILSNKLQSLKNAKTDKQ